MKPDTDAKVLKAKLSVNRTGPYKVLAVGPCSSADTPGGSPLGAKLLYVGVLAAKREIYQSNGKRFLAPGYDCLSRAPVGPADTATPCFPTGPTFGAQATTVCGGSGKSPRPCRRVGYTWFDFRRTRD